MRIEVFIELDYEQSFDLGFGFDKLKIKNSILERLGLNSDLPNIIFLDRFTPSHLSYSYNDSEKRIEKKKKKVSTIALFDVSADDIETLYNNKEVKGIFSNPAISLFSVNSDTAIGREKELEDVLNLNEFEKNNATGKGVLVAIVDGGINKDLLKGICQETYKREPTFYDYFGLTKFKSDNPTHATKVAYDVLISAPDSLILDVPLPWADEKLQVKLDFAYTVFEDLKQLMIKRPKLEDDKYFKSMVITNSWGIFHQSEEFIPSPLIDSYSDNIKHKFNLLVSEMAGLGIDIVFAAGNCGEGDPNSNCKCITNHIYGANSHKDVLCVAGATLLHENDYGIKGHFRLAYSNKGPGLLDKGKPDLAGFTHFQTNYDDKKLNNFHQGTSFACPLVAGIVAAIRSIEKYSHDNSNDETRYIPSQIREILINNSSIGVDSTCDWSNTQGIYKVVDGTKLSTALFGHQRTLFEKLKVFLGFKL